MTALAITTLINSVYHFRSTQTSIRAYIFLFFFFSLCYTSKLIVRRKIHRQPFSWFLFDLITRVLITSSASFGLRVPFVPYRLSLCDPYVSKMIYTMSERDNVLSNHSSLVFNNRWRAGYMRELENIITCGAGPTWMRVSIKACQIRCANSSVWIYYYYGLWNASEYCLHADEGPNAETSDQITLH